METPAPLAQDYIKAKQAKGAADVLSRLEKRLTPPAPAGQPPKPPAGATAKPQDAQKAAGATSAAGRTALASTAAGMAGAAAKDVLAGTIETVSGRSLLYGVGKAADEMMDTIGGVIGLDFDKAEEWVERVTGLPISDKHMEELAPNSTTGKLTAGVAQFIAGMAPVAKAMQGVGLAAQLGRAGTSVVAGAIGDAAAFDEHAERLSNLVQSVPGLSNPVTGYLAAEEDDTVLEGKIKQLLEGAGVGAAAEAVMGGIRVIKRWRDARAAMPEAEAQAAVKKAEREVAAGVDAASDEALGLTPRDWMTLGGAPEKPLFEVTEAVEARAAKLVEGMRPDELDLVLGQLRAPSSIKKPVSLLSYLRSRGGLREEGGELAARDLRNRMPGLVNNKGGLTLEDASRSAAEAGYLPDLQKLDRVSGEAGERLVTGADRDVLLRAIDDELRGTPRFRENDPDAIAYEGLNRWQGVLDELGIDPRKASNAEIKEAIAKMGAKAKPAASKEAQKLVDEAEAEGLDLGASPRQTGEDIAADAADKGYFEGLETPGRVKLGDRVGNINLSRLSTEDDVRHVIRETAKLQGIPETARQSTDIAREMADELLTDPDKLRTMMSGQSAAGRAFTREEIIATGSLLAQNGQAISNLAKKIVGGAATDVEKLALKRAMAFQETLLRTVSGQAREAGRALQAFQTQTAGSGMSARAIRDLLADGVPAERLAAVVSKLSPREINAAAKGGWWKNAGDALFESWMGSKLLSPWTHARNVVGNSLTLFTSIPERALAARLSAKGTGVEPGEAAEMAYAAISGFRDALRAAGSAFKSSLPSDVDAAVKGEIKAGGSPHRRAITAGKLGLDESSPLGKAVDFYGSWITGTAFRGLVAEDEFFKSIARRMQLHAVAYRTAHREGLTSPESMSARMAELLAEPPPWLWDEAVSFGRHVTFQDPMKEVGIAVAKIRSSTPFGRYVMPFLQTPANIFKYAMARTPLAPIMPSWRADLAAGGARRDLALAKVSMGSLVMATAADWVAQGHITGGRPSDPHEGAAWDRQGKLPYAAKIGDRWVQYNQLEPLGLTMGVAADVAQLLDLADDVKGLAADPAALDRAYQKLIKAGMTPEEASRATQRAEEQMSEGFTALPGVVVSSLAYNLLEKSYLSGLSDLADVIFAPSAEARTQAASRYVQDFATGFVPLDAPIRWAERMVDPELREAKGLVEALKAMTPGLSDDMPPLPNLWGEPRRSAVAYSPFGTLPPTSSPIDQALEKVGYFPSMPQKSIQGVRLTPEQYVEYVRLAGNELKGPGGLGAKDTLDSIVTGKHAMSKAWERGSDGPDGGKAHVVRTVVEGFREVARIEMLRRHPELRILAEEGKAVKAQGRATLAGPPQIR